MVIICHIDMGYLITLTAKPYVMTLASVYSSPVNKVVARLAHSTMKPQDARWSMVSMLSMNSHGPKDPRSGSAQSSPPS
jgi:hypothetical protein